MASRALRFTQSPGGVSGPDILFDFKGSEGMLGGRQNTQKVLEVPKQSLEGRGGW